MIKVIYAASWLARRRFYSFSHHLYGQEPKWQEPSIWGKKKVLSPIENPMCRLPHALLMAVEDGKIIARVLVGANSQSKTGYFSLFDARDNLEAVRKLMDEARLWQRKQGMKTWVGAIAPTPLDLGGGVLCEGFENAPVLYDAYNFSYYEKYLKQCGFDVESEWLTYRMNLQQFPHDKYHHIAKWVVKRFGYTVKTDLSRHPRVFSEAICEIMGEQPEVIQRWLGVLMRDIAHGLCPVVYEKERPVAFLLSIRKKGYAVRVVTMWVHESQRRTGITAILFDELAQTMRQMNMTEIDASLIRADNTASRISMEAAGGILSHRHRIYKSEI